jgi:serine/threonine protein phosphatase PrpC
MRAINESRADYDLLKNRFAYPMDEALIIDLGNTTFAPYKLEICADIAEDIGSRSSMEDAHFYVATEYGLLAGVFDGHAGSRTAQSIASAFPQIFEEQMRLSDRHVRYAFTKTFEILHKAFFDIYDDGSAGVVSLIDVESNLIYTATLGDSEASISRCIDDEYSLIPLSCVRDWTCKKEYERGAASFKADKKRAEAFRSEMSTLKQKHLRYSPNKVANDARFPYDGNPGPNLSRAFGDKPFFTYNNVDVMSCKPKISVQYLRPGDLVLIACDGLWDYLDKHEIIDVLREADEDLPSGSSIPLELIKKAKTNFPYRGGGDNISIIALTVGYAS